GRAHTPRRVQSLLRPARADGEPCTAFDRFARLRREQKADDARGAGSCAVTICCGFIARLSSTFERAKRGGRASALRLRLADEFSPGGFNRSSSSRASGPDYFTCQ